MTLYAIDPITGDFSTEPMSFTDANGIKHVATGIHELTWKVDFPIDRDTWPYQVKVENIAYDPSPRYYEINLVRKDNNLDVSSIYYNGRIAKPVSEPKVTLDLDGNGNLVLQGAGDENLLDSSRLRKTPGSSTPLYLPLTMAS